MEDAGRTFGPVGQARGVTSSADANNVIGGDNAGDREKRPDSYCERAVSFAFHAGYSFTSSVSGQ